MGVRICGSYFTAFKFFYVLTKPGKKKKRTAFHSFLQAENYFGQVVFKPEVYKFFILCFTTWVLVQSPTVLWYLQWRVQPTLVCSTVFLELQAEVLLVFNVLFLKQVLYISYFIIRCGPKNEVSRVLGEVEHQDTLFDIFSTMKGEFKCFKLVHSLILYVLFNKYCFATYLNVAWDQCVLSLRRNLSL